MTSIIWQLCIGLGVFIYGMHQLENGIQALGATRLRLWIANSTKNASSSCLTGVGITALLQSSSMVSLLVLAFASAGMLPLLNAISVLLGANLGTTATGWLVATIGFKLDLEQLALPLFALGGFGVVVMNDKPRIANTARILLGIGLLLFGLSLMKNSVDSLPDYFDISSLHGHNIFIYFLCGAVLTAIIQSSSATMMLTLAAVHSDIISLYYAAAFIIGADLGTTSTTILGSLSGSKIKKQLAFSHVFYNFVIDISALFLLIPIMIPFYQLIGLVDPLYSLVAFHSITNMLGLLVFMPLLGRYTAWIEKIFSDNNDACDFEHIPVDVPDAAIKALENEIYKFWYQSLNTRLSCFGLDYHRLSLNGQQTKLIASFDVTSPLMAYQQLKQHESRLFRYIAKLQTRELNQQQSLQASTLLQVIRALIYSSKTIKDIQHNILELSHDSSQLAQKLHKSYQAAEISMLNGIVEMVEHGSNDQDIDNEYQNLLKRNNQQQLELDQMVYDYCKTEGIDCDLSSLLNINRELHHANKVLLNNTKTWALLINACHTALDTEQLLVEHFDK